MGLNKSKGNMYDFVTHTWNTVRGRCLHDCGYCYMKGIARRFHKEQPPLYFDEKALDVNLGNGNFIFVGSSNDLFASGVPEEWILKTLHYCSLYDNKYLLQSKNPARILDYIDTWFVCDKSVVCTTIETNRHYPHVTKNCPTAESRAEAMIMISEVVPAYVTIEPVMDFDLPELVELIKRCGPKQVNIGADSGNNHLPEPSREKVLELIAELERFTTVKQKSNLRRILTPINNRL